MFYKLKDSFANNFSAQRKFHTNTVLQKLSTGNATPKNNFSDIFEQVQGGRSFL